MSKCKKQVNTFVLEGRFLETLGKSPLKPKSIRLATPEGEQVIKLSKALRPLFTENQLQVGSWLTVSGLETYKPKKEERKRKIYEVVSHPMNNVELLPKTSKKDKKDKKDKILVCQKSSCCKRGGKAVYQAAKEAVEKHQLLDRIEVKPTGCMGKCKQGPCLVMQGNKSRHLGIKPKEVQKLISEQYLSQ